MENKNSSLKIIFLALGSILTAITIFSLGFILGQKSLPKAIPIDSELKTPLSSPPPSDFFLTSPFPTSPPLSNLEETASWKTYILGSISLKLPPDWKVGQSQFSPNDQYGYDFRLNAASPDYKFTERTTGIAGGSLDSGMNFEFTGINITNLRVKYPQVKQNEKIEDDLNYTSDDPRFKNLPREKNVEDFFGRKFAVIYNLAVNGDNYATYMATTYEPPYGFQFTINFPVSKKADAKKFFHQILSTFKFLN